MNLRQKNEILTAVYPNDISYLAPVEMNLEDSITLFPDDESAFALTPISGQVQHVGHVTRNNNGAVFRAILSYRNSMEPLTLLHTTALLINEGLKVLTRRIGPLHNRRVHLYRPHAGTEPPTILSELEEMAGYELRIYVEKING